MTKILVIDLAKKLNFLNQNSKFQNTAFPFQKYFFIQKFSITTKTASVNLELMCKLTTN
jgi:hypothetical protein